MNVIAFNHVSGDNFGQIYGMWYLIQDNLELVVGLVFISVFPIITRFHSVHKH